MNEKTKNMLHKMQDMTQQCEVTNKSLLQRGKDMLNKINFKGVNKPMVSAGALGLVAAAGLTYYLAKR
jgi:hypothetical protein